MISVVVPIFNEEENLPELRRRMTGALDSTGEAWEHFGAGLREVFYDYFASPADGAQ